MSSEARKIHVIEEVLKVQSEAVLIEIESFLKRKGGEEKKEINGNKNKPSDYVGSISEETAKELLHQIEQSRNEWEKDI